MDFHAGDRTSAALYSIPGADKDEQYRLIQELLAKRNDPEAQQLLDRYIELFYAMHKSKTETKKEKENGGFPWRVLSLDWWVVWY